MVELTPDRSWTRPGAGDVVLAGPADVVPAHPRWTADRRGARDGTASPARTRGADGPPARGRCRAPGRRPRCGPRRPGRHRRADPGEGRGPRDALPTGRRAPRLAPCRRGRRRRRRLDRPDRTDRRSPRRAPRRERGAGGGPHGGLAATTAPFVFTVDADVVVDRPARVLAVLRAHLDDDRVAIAAPRVRAATGPGWLSAYDAHRSPLDLGDEPARVRALTRVSYVRRQPCSCGDAPSRRSAVSTRRPVRRGRRPRVAARRRRLGMPVRAGRHVSHTVRPTLRRWCRQRRQYGTAAAPLARRHPARPPLAHRSLERRGLGARRRRSSAARSEHRSGDDDGGVRPNPADMPERTSVAVRYAGLGNLHAGRLLAAAVTRSWWPIALVVCLVSRRARRAVAVAALAPALVDWVRMRPRVDPVRWIVLRLLDDASYGLGVWVGCVTERSAAALAPELTGTRSRRPAGR